MITLKRTDSSDAAFHFLVKFLNNDLWKRYPEEQATYDKHNKIENNNTVVVVFDNDQPVGCGCIKNVDTNTAEIKRMFVMESHRGKGISKLIMKELEQWARELRIHRLILETGNKQPEAISLYQKCGYTQIDNYPPYIGMPSSICMEKVI